MNLQRIVALAIGFVLGIVAVESTRLHVPAVGLFAAAAAGALASALLWRRERRWLVPHPALVVAAAMLAAAPLGYWRAWSRVGPPPAGSLRSALAAASAGAGARLEFQGFVCAEPEPSGPLKGELRLRVDRLRIADSGAWQTVRPADIAVAAYQSEDSRETTDAAFRRVMDPTAYGYRVDVVAEYRGVERSLNPGAFDPESFLLQNDLVARVRCPIGRIAVLAESRGHVAVELALAAKKAFLGVYRVTVRAPASRLVAGATLGSRGAVSGVAYRGMDIALAFRRAGVGHVLAVSGLHVSVVAVLLLWVSVSAGLRPRVFVPFVLVFLALFALLTGARPSCVRAVVMNGTVLTAYAFGRMDLRRATYAGLSLSALVILSLKPIVLFSPSFLLSYGAVLSLVLLTPVVDRWLLSLRGFAVAGGLAWVAGLIVILGACPQILFDIRVAATGVAVLAALLTACARLNARRPAAWSFGLERVPGALRLFVAGQLAIQVGMMLPLSAWFFGRFPVAGIFVNLVAIPAIGLVIQLGLLTGMVGLIPVVGPWLALPIGATLSVLGDAFYLLAWFGAVAFPYPSLPRPSLAWTAGYYTAVGMLVGARAGRPHLQRLLHALWRKPVARRRVALVLAVVVFLALAVPPVLRARLGRRCLSVTCVAARRYPVLAIAADDRTAVTLNAGDARTGSGGLFGALRSAGAATVDTALLCSAAPDAGLEGLAALSQRMRVGRCLAPVVAPAPDYLAALGDGYLLRQAAIGETWALRYGRAYSDLTATLSAAGIPFETMPTGTLLAWRNLHLAALPAAQPAARRTTASLSRILRLRTGGFEWVIVTDADDDALRAQGVAQPQPCDVLVLPELSQRSSYGSLLESAALAFPARVALVAGDRPPRDIDLEAFAARHRLSACLSTGRDGAVTATLPADGSLRLRAYRSGRVVSLPARPL